MTSQLPAGPFRLIYADPPWEFRDKQNAGNRGAAHKYQTMKLEDICSLPVRQIAGDTCLLAMWWVSTMPREALDVCDAWGFKFYKMDGFTWRKLTVNGAEHFGMGMLTRANVEHCLFGVRGKVSDIRVDAGVRQVINAKKGAHSEKPQAARDSLIRLCGDVPRIELFARQAAPGWHAWGNEISSGYASPYERGSVEVRS